MKDNLCLSCWKRIEVRQPPTGKEWAYCAWQRLPVSRCVWCSGYQKGLPSRVVVEHVEGEDVQDLLRRVARAAGLRW